MRLPSVPFRGKIEGGRIQLEQREQFAALIQRLDGQDVEIILRKQRKQRSLPQNSYYWAVIVPILGEHCGYDQEETHEALKMRFLQTHGAHPQPSNRALPTVRSTTSLDTGEMTEYIESCRQLAAEMGVYIPSPGEAV